MRNNRLSTTPMTDPTLPPITAYTLPPVRRWVAYIALCIGMFMAILDIQVVVTSLKVIEEALNIGADLMSWVQTAYIIAEVIAIPLTGLLMRVFSMRWLFVFSLGVFTLASLGCAFSHGFTELMIYRVIQGYAGGVLIPLVFSAIFLLFPKGYQQTIATTLGGILAVMAPTLGPITGGWLTEHFSWQWLFLINLIPGIIATAVGLLTLPRSPLRLNLLRDLDWLSLLAFGLSLASLVIGLKQAPQDGWLDPIVLGCFTFSLACLVFSVMRPKPAIMFYLLHDKALAYGCVLSFILGFILYASVYLLPVFLGFVRNHGPLEIGIFTVAMGLTQLVAAPVTVLIDRYLDARWLSAIGFLLFAAGLWSAGNLTVMSDQHEVFWPQVWRGAAVGLCILPPIRFAMGLVPLDKVSDASGLFNLARNIGGVIGIAVTDSIMFTRAATHAETLIELTKTDPAAAAPILGINVDQIPAPDDPMGIFGLMDTVQAASLTQAINECWWTLAAVSLSALPILWWMGHVPSAMPISKQRKLQAAAAALPAKP
jgi:MFS transporter, DHA2 family, multidrug resistance protein